MDDVAIDLSYDACADDPEAQAGRDFALAALRPSTEDIRAAVPRIEFPDSWRLIDDVELMELPDPAFIIDGVVPRAGVGVIYSPSGAGKTTLVSSLQVALATRGDWFGHRVLEQCASVYIAAEDLFGWKMRTRAAKRAARLPLDQPIGVFTFPEPIDLRDPVAVVRFPRFLKQVEWPMPLGCIIVDTYAASTPGASENSSEDTTTAMVHAQHWRDALGVTVILAHHTNAGGSRERGHTAMRGAADFMISLTPVDDAIHLECSKQRNAAPFEKILLKMVPTPDGDGCVLRLATDVLSTSGLTAMQERVYSILRDTFAQSGASKSEWQRTCHDVPERSFHRAAKMLEERGYVKQIGSHFRVTGKETAR
jgi:hypothetical protein